MRIWISYRKLPLFVAMALLVVWALGCASTAAYKTIDGATDAVQAATKAYKRHCGVAPGEPGPGTCNGTEYALAQDAYVKFQATANAVVSVAEKTGQTPLQVITDAAAQALKLIPAVAGGH